MPVEKQLEPMLKALAYDVPAAMPGDFMEQVWERVGVVSGRRDRSVRMALFAVLFAVGLGAGASTVPATAYAQGPTYLLADDVRLSPASLLHAGL